MNKLMTQLQDWFNKKRELNTIPSLIIYYLWMAVLCLGLPLLLVSAIMYMIPTAEAPDQNLIYITAAIILIVTVLTIVYQWIADSITRKHNTE